MEVTYEEEIVSTARGPGNGSVDRSCCSRRGFDDGCHGHTLSFFTNLTALPEDLNDLPEDSSLQRAIKAHLLAGNTLKSGFGARYQD